MRPDTQTTLGERASYAQRTAVELRKSQEEVRTLLQRFGATDFALVEGVTSATVSFALTGRYVEFVLPLPDRFNRALTHTPTGKPRSAEARARAYEQALRRQWRALVLVTKGKLRAVESGISTVEREFFPAAALVAGPADEGSRERRGRRARAVFTVIGAAMLVPASSLAALTLPFAAVERMVSPVWGTQPAMFEVAAPAAGTSSLDSSVPRSSGGDREQLVARLAAAREHAAASKSPDGTDAADQALLIEDRSSANGPAAGGAGDGGAAGATAAPGAAGSSSGSGDVSTDLSPATSSATVSATPVAAAAARDNGSRDNGGGAKLPAGATRADTGKLVDTGKPIRTGRPGTGATPANRPRPAEKPEPGTAAEQKPENPKPEERANPAPVDKLEQPKAAAVDALTAVYPGWSGVRDAGRPAPRP